MENEPQPKVIEATDDAIRDDVAVAAGQAALSGVTDQPAEEVAPDPSPAPPGGQGSAPSADEEQPGPGEKILSEVVIQFDSQGNMGARFSNMKPNLLWAAGRFLDTLGTRMWNENRDAEVMAQIQEQEEINRVANMLGKGGRGPIDLAGRRGGRH